MRFIGALAAALCTFASVAYAEQEHKNELRITPMDHKFNDYVLPMPHTYIDQKVMPTSFNWGNVNGVSYLTKNLNQHIPQYCGSCWAHGSMSSFGDRIKIARKAQGIDVNLAIQFILNCGSSVAGSCYGGDAASTFEFVKSVGHVPYDTCMQYAACSQDSNEGLCSQGDYTCTALNTCRTCSTFTQYGGKCVEVNYYPNATIAEYGTIAGAAKMQAEIYARGPIACDVNATPLHTYTGGVFHQTGQSTEPNHVISVVGWGHDSVLGKDYWIVRNSWGEYWGERGFFRIVKGENLLGIEGHCAWATPGSWTEMNVPCYEDGSNCDGKTATAAVGHYVDASLKKPWHL